MILRIPVLVFVIGLVAGCSDIERIEFTEIGDHDEIEVIYYGMGCFNFDLCKFIFTQGGTVRMWETDEELERADPEWGWGLENQLKFVGGTTLTPGELADLEVLLRHYRREIEDSCTSKVSLDIRYRRDLRTIGFENTFDEMCKAPEVNIDFDRLAQRIRKEAEAENKSSPLNAASRLGVRK